MVDKNLVTEIRIRYSNSNENKTIHLKKRIETEENNNVGKYGRMWVAHMKETYPVRYQALIEIGELVNKAREVNAIAIDLYEDLESEWIEKYKSKNNSFPERMEVIRRARLVAEEAVMVDVIRQFH